MTDGSMLTVKNIDALSFKGFQGDAILFGGEYYKGCSGMLQYHGVPSPFKYDPKNCELSFAGQVLKKKNCPAGGK